MKPSAETLEKVYRDLGSNPTYATKMRRVLESRSDAESDVEAPDVIRVKIRSGEYDMNHIDKIYKRLDKKRKRAKPAATPLEKEMKLLERLLERWPGVEGMPAEAMSGIAQVRVMINQAIEATAQAPATPTGPSPDEPKLPSPTELHVLPYTKVSIGTGKLKRKKSEPATLDRFREIMIPQIQEIVAEEWPIHVNEVRRRLFNAWDVHSGRETSRKFTTCMQESAVSLHVSGDQEFLLPEGKSLADVDFCRHGDTEKPGTVRSIDEIAIEEIAVALRLTDSESHGKYYLGHIQAAAKVLGLRPPIVQNIKIIERYMLAMEQLKNNDELNTKKGTDNV